MSGAVLVGVVLLLMVCSLGLAAVFSVPRWRAPQWLGRVCGRGAVIVEVSVGQMGRLLTATVVVLAGGGLIVAVLWLIGWPIKLAEQMVDVPAFQWWAASSADAPQWWSRAWLTLTNIGGLNLTQLLTVLFAVAIAVLWRRGRWWIPLVVLPAAYVIEKTLQDLLKLVVDRGHPPTTLGSFPSGGCARVILVYGLIVFLLLWGAQPRDRRVWVGGAAFVAVCATVQAYARTVNLEHWITDVLAGLLFGLMLLATMVASVVVLDREAPDLHAAEPHVTDDGDRLPSR